MDGDGRDGMGRGGTTRWRRGRDASRARVGLGAALLAVGLVVGGAAAQGQTASDAAAADMQTDRPGFNAPAAVLDAGVLQVELGWAMARQRDGGTSSTGPQPLLRVGVGHRLELQLGTNGLEAGCLADCRWRASDLALGARYALPAEPLGLALAVTGSLSLPTGDGVVTSHHADPSITIHVDRSLGPRLELSYNYLVVRPHEDAPRAAMRYGHGVSVGTAAGRWGPYLGLARRAARVDGRVPWLVQVGTTVRLARDVQADVTVDRGIVRAEPTWGVAAGLVLRRRPR